MGRNKHFPRLVMHASFVSTQLPGRPFLGHLPEEEPQDIGLSGKAAEPGCEPNCSMVSQLPQPGLHEAVAGLVVPENTDVFAVMGDANEVIYPVFTYDNQWGPAASVCWDKH